MRSVTNRTIDKSYLIVELHWSLRLRYEVMRVEMTWWMIKKSGHESPMRDAHVRIIMIRSSRTDALCCDRAWQIDNDARFFYWWKAITIWATVEPDEQINIARLIILTHRTWTQGIALLFVSSGPRLIQIITMRENDWMRHVALCIDTMRSNTMKTNGDH